MKTIKYLSILLMTILCLGTVSCSKDDDEKKKIKMTLRTMKMTRMMRMIKQL